MKQKDLLNQFQEHKFRLSCQYDLLVEMLDETHDEEWIVEIQRKLTDIEVRMDNINQKIESMF